MLEIYKNNENVDIILKIGEFTIKIGYQSILKIKTIEIINQKHYLNLREKKFYG